MKKKPTRGGARKGAGRKPTGKGESFTVRISKEAKANIKAEAKATKKSASKLVDEWARRLKL